MGVHTGEYGCIEGVSNVRNWSISEEATAEMVRNSSTKGAAARVSGVKRVTGSYEAESGIPFKMPGESFTPFKGYTAPDDDVFGSDGVTANVAAIVESVTINLNWSGNESVNHSVEFQGTDELTFVTEFIEDPGPLAIGSICDVKIEYGAEGAEVLIENIESATLTFTRENQAYINSSTNCVESYKSGPLDWTLEIVLQDNVRPIALQADERFKVWINDTEFYILEYGHVEAYNDLSVDPQTGAIITQSMSVVMQAARQSDGVVGKIILPGGSTYWPPAAPTVSATVKGKNDAPALGDKKKATL